MRKLAVILTVAFTAALAGVRAAPAEAQDVPTVAVLDFQGFMMGDAGATVSLGKVIAAMLVTEFSQRDGIKVIERQQLRAMLDEQGLVMSGRVSESSAIEMGKMLGVQYVLTGQATDIVGNLRMDIRAVDVETSEVVSVLKKSGQTSDLLEVVVELADDFGEQLNLTPPSERPEVEEIPIAATIAFSRAMDHEDRGEIDQAIEFYERTLEIAPGHRDARLALERLRGEGEG